ncbi:MAG TPA: hypothetical protein VJ810_40945 [Blastocatellia bacterium]|nr:hypothetical protein [Blastocatellia bacterium]
MILVGAVQRVDQRFDGAARLITELIGDLLPVFGALAQHRVKRLVIRRGEEAARADCFSYV